jgi:hypothetical protein
LPTDRRTRDRVRVVFWAVLAVVCVAAVLAARQQQRQTLTRRAEAVQERAYRYTRSVLTRSLTPARVGHPIRGARASTLTASLRHGLLGDPHTARIRVWRLDGLLVFTTDDPSKIGKLSPKDAGTKAAIGGAVESLIRTETFAPDTQTTAQPTELLATYVPLRRSGGDPVYGVVEIDTYYGQLRAGSASPWNQLQIAFALIALLCLVMTVASFRWSRRPPGVLRPGPTRRETRAADRDEKKLAAAQSDVATLRGRVKELEAATGSAAGHESELVRLRERVSELESRPVPGPTPEPGPAAAPAGPDPAETEQLRARAAQLEEQGRYNEGRMSQLQSRVTEMEAQLRLTTDQLRSAQRRLDDQPTQMREQLRAAEENERRLTDALQTAKNDLERVERERAEAEQAHAEEMLTQRSQLDEVRAQARMAEEERRKILAETVRATTAVDPPISPATEGRMRELEESLERSEHERAMLRAGRPETVYEARNRELEDELVATRTSLASVEQQARVEVASAAGVGIDVIAALEARIAAAEERASEAERRLNQRPGRRSRSVKRNGENGAEPVEEDDELAAQLEPDAPVDGSELRSRLVRSADARRRGSAPTPDRTQAPDRR